VRKIVNFLLNWARDHSGRPPFDPVMMFKILVIQATNNLSDVSLETTTVSSQHLESRFFKSVLGRVVASGVKRTRHQLAPAMPGLENPVYPRGVRDLTEWGLWDFACETLGRDCKILSQDRAGHLHPTAHLQR
jgi:Transposase domain (DUF772)